MLRQLPLWLLLIASLLLLPGVGEGGPAHSALVVSVSSGRWSEAATWRPRSVPGPGARVRIERGTSVVYDLFSDRELGEVVVAGTLDFSRNRSTRLDAAGVIVEAGGVLEMGRPGRPLPPGVTAEVRLVVPEGATFQGGGFVREDVGIWVRAGGRWEVHGAPVRHTWVKLARPARTGESTVTVAEDVADWPLRAQVLLTPTGVSPTAEQFEERTLLGVRRLGGGLVTLHLSSPLASSHDGGGEISGEVALLSRNVRITSKYPQRTKAHTAYLSGAAGSIAYSEFKELGSLGVVGRYPIHFHRMGDSARGMVVKGASIWRSDNHFLNVHGSNGIAIVDTVGYDAPGHGFFVERALPGTSPHGSGGEDQTASPPGRKKDRGSAERASRGRKDEPRGDNVGTTFIHNLAAKGFWRPGSLDEPRRIALFWISSLNMTLIDNVAVGASGGRDSAGFHLAEGQDYTPEAPPLTMVHNEARSNGGHGLFTWTNAKAPLDIVALRAWRNGISGASVGAYNNRLRLFNSRLLENGQHNLGIWVVRAWVQDSLLARAPVGVFFHRHPVSGDPADPTMLVRVRFEAHAAAHIAQDHRSCGQPEEERVPTSRRCPANYAVFLRPEFGEGRTLDFGWHENAHSWIELHAWRGPADLPSSVRVVRRDQEQDGSRLYGPFDARIHPVQRSAAVPPTVALTLRSREGQGSLTLRAQVAGEGGAATVEFFVDGVLLGRAAAPPYEWVWRPGPGARRNALLYARAVDRTGGIAYSQVLTFLSGAR